MVLADFPLEGFVGVALGWALVGRHRPADSVGLAGPRIRSLESEYASNTELLYPGLCLEMPNLPDVSILSGDLFVTSTIKGQRGSAQSVLLPLVHMTT
jgi:hypothetical protein